jgi:hypothetical protein
MNRQTLALFTLIIALLSPSSSQAQVDNVAAMGAPCWYILKASEDYSAFVNVHYNTRAGDIMGYPYLIIKQLNFKSGPTKGYYKIVYGCSLTFSGLREPRDKLAITSITLEEYDANPTMRVTEEDITTTHPSISALYHCTCPTGPSCTDEQLKKEWRGKKPPSFCVKTS